MLIEQGKDKDIIEENMTISHIWNQTQKLKTCIQIDNFIEEARNVSDIYH